MIIGSLCIKNALEYVALYAMIMLALHHMAYAWSLPNMECSYHNPKFTHFYIMVDHEAKYIYVAQFLVTYMLFITMATSYKCIHMRYEHEAT